MQKWKPICKLLAFVSAMALVAPESKAQSQDQTYVLGGNALARQLLVNIRAGGKYGVHRHNIIGWNKQFYKDEDIFAIKIGSKTYSATADFTITDISAVTTGIQQEVIKKFSGVYTDSFTFTYPFSVTVRFYYNTSNPDYLTMTADVDATGIPAGTPISLAYGFDAYVNGCDVGVAMTIPDAGFNNSPSGRSEYLTTAQVRTLRMVGGINGRGIGSLIGFFSMGRPFDRATSECYTTTYAWGMANGTRQNNRFHFGPYNVVDCSAVGYCNYDDPQLDNGVGVAWDSIPAGQITTIPVGLTFTTDMDGELDYTWNGSKDLQANINDDVTLDLQYISQNSQPLSGIGFSIDFPGLRINNACSQDNFTAGTFDGSPGNEYYTVSEASVNAYEKAHVHVPVRVTQCGQWVVNANSISAMARTLPLGRPAVLTVHSAVDFLPEQESLQLCGIDSMVYTIRLPEGVTSSGGFTVALSYAGDVDAFVSLPSSINFPANTNSVNFTVKTLTPTTPASLTITMAGTNRPYISTGNASTLTLQMKLLSSLVVNDTAACYGTPVTIAAVSANTFATAAWYYDAGYTDRITSASSFTFAARDTVFYAELSGDNVCPSRDSVKVTAYPVPGLMADSATICSGQLPYTWEGEVFTEAGVKTKTLRTRLGCDSTVTFTLAVHPAYPNIRETVVICADQLPYTWEGEVFTSSGSKTKTLRTRLGCDSTVTFTLTVHPVYHAAFFRDVCADALPYVWDGHVFHSAGSHTHYYKTVDGCDSVEQHVLFTHALPNVVIYGDPLICGDSRNSLSASGALSYTWSTGETGADIHVSAAGVYSVTGVNEYSCINRKFITVRQVALPFVETSDTAVCYGSVVDLHARSWSGTLEWNVPPHFAATVSDTYTVRAVNECGAESGTLALTVLGEIKPILEELPSFRNERYYEVLLTYSGGSSPVVFTSKERLPPGLMLSPSGMLSGTPVVDDGDYRSYDFTVQLEDEYRCTAMAHYTLERMFWAPNTLIRHSSTNSFFLPGLEVEIYNRHGALIYKGKGWDGFREGGSPVASGTYFYKTRYLKNTVWTEVSGYITILPGRSE